MRRGIRGDLDDRTDPSRSSVPRHPDDGHQRARCRNQPAHRAEAGGVFVTAHERYALEAFGVQALDYLLKPFEEDRFLATLERVRAWTAARRAKRTHEHLVALLRELSETPLAELERLRAPAMAIRFADMEADPATRRVSRAGRSIALRPKEYDLLVALMRRGGELVTRRELLVEVWGYREDVTSRTVDTHVATLRRKLGHSPDEVGYVTTVAKTGYRLR